jgi:hypothetical protein
VRHWLAGLTDTRIYKEAVEIGQTAGGLATLGGTVGLIAAALVNAFHPRRRVSYGDWTAVLAAVAACLATGIELLSRLGLL